MGDEALEARGGESSAAAVGEEEGDAPEWIGAGAGVEAEGGGEEGGVEGGEGEDGGAEEAVEAAEVGEGGGVEDAGPAAADGGGGGDSEASGWIERRARAYKQPSRTRLLLLGCRFVNRTQSPDARRAADLGSLLYTFAGTRTRVGCRRYYFSGQASPNMLSVVLNARRRWSAWPSRSCVAPSRAGKVKRAPPSEFHPAQGSR